tara:strand:- start:23 stop:766 length:744 start_codon:yes stop_codon:yes gene_type:complete
MIITFAHYKGGTGKTTSCINTAGHLAKLGKKVLVVDLDPQANATSGLGIDKNTLNEHMYHVMNKRRKIDKIILKTNIDNLHLAPSHTDLGKTNIFYYKRKSDAHILKKALDRVKYYYDFILIDTPPVHGHFIINGMMAADKIVVVLEPGIFSIEGVETLQNSFGKFLNRLGLKLNIDMVLITKVPKKTLSSFFKPDYIKDIKKEAENLITRNIFMIPHSDLIYYSQVYGLPISHFKPKSKISKTYYS